MKRYCSIRMVEFYNDYEKTSIIDCTVDEKNSIEQIKLIVDSYSVLKRFTNNDYIETLFVKAVLFDDKSNELFSIVGENFNKII